MTEDASSPRRRLKAAAIRLLSTREHARQELKAKLQRWWRQQERKARERAESRPSGRAGWHPLPEEGGWPAHDERQPLQDDRGAPDEASWQDVAQDDLAPVPKRPVRSSCPTLAELADQALEASATSDAAPAPAASSRRSPPRMPATHVAPTSQPQPQPHVPEPVEDWERFFEPAQPGRADLARAALARLGQSQHGEPPLTPSPAAARSGGHVRTSRPDSGRLGPPGSQASVSNVMPALPEALVLADERGEPPLAAEVLEAVLEQVLDDLAREQWQSDERFVESFVHRHARKQGALKIRQGLQQKGVPAEQIKEAMAGLKGSELERAIAAWRKRFAAPPADAKARAQQMRFLAARGFPADVVRQVLSRAGAPDDDDA